MTQTPSRPALRNTSLLDAASGRPTGRPPVWIMRQAGRYLAEYRRVRALFPSFLDFCRSPEHVAEVTIQPVDIIGVDAAILFAPAGGLVPVALAGLDRGGTLAIAGIHLTQIPPLDYERHLFQEHTLRSVTANTRADGEELLRLAPRLGVQVHVTEYAFDEVDRALADLAGDRLSGSAVVTGYPGRMRLT